MAGQELMVFAAKGLSTVQEKMSFMTIWNSFMEYGTTWEKEALGEDREPTFFLWFRQNKAADFCTGALKGMRELAGLGSPPTTFYTNPNESMNSALKEKTNYTKMQWPEFNERMKAFVKE